MNPLMSPARNFSSSKNTYWGKNYLKHDTHIYIAICIIAYDLSDVLIVGRAFGGERVGIRELLAAIGVVRNLIVLDLGPNLYQMARGSGEREANRVKCAS